MLKNTDYTIFTKEFDEAMSNLGEKNYSEVTKNLDDITEDTIKLLDPDLYAEIERKKMESK